MDDRFQRIIAPHKKRRQSLGLELNIKSKYRFQDIKDYIYRFFKNIRSFTKIEKKFLFIDIIYNILHIIYCYN